MDNNSLSEFDLKRDAEARQSSDALNTALRRLGVKLYMKSNIKKKDILRKKEKY